MEIQGVSKDICNVVSSGSKGNCIIYHETIAVDMGIPYKMIKEYKNSLQLVVLSHSHLDHINISTIKKLSFERPSLRFCCGHWMVKYLEGIRNVDILEAGAVYDYGNFAISPITLYHDVLNFGFRIFKGDHKTLHVTDTSHLEGITAKDYNLYAIEANYNDDTIHDSIERIQSKGGFAYQIGVLNSHLSEQQARDFIFKNGNENSKVIRLHESARS